MSLSTKTDVDANGRMTDSEHPCPLCGSECRLWLRHRHANFKFYWYCSSECSLFSETHEGSISTVGRDLDSVELSRQTAAAAKEKAEEVFERGFDITRQQEIAHQHRNGATIRRRCKTTGCDSDVEGLLPPNECEQCGNDLFEVTIID